MWDPAPQHQEGIPDLLRGRVPRTSLEGPCEDLCRASASLTHICNLSHLWGWDCGPRPAREGSWQDPISTYSWI
jgi:hypothetical protein